MSPRLRAMTPDDYDAVLALWRRCPEIGLNESDGPTETAAFLARNPGMSAVALDATGAVIGAVLCGWDGRRGYLHHLAVDAPLRGRGVGRALLAWCRRELERCGVPKCNVFLFGDNVAGAAFWSHAGFAARDDLVVHQAVLPGGRAGGDERGGASGG